jgi:hypothetical protein
MKRKRINRASIRTYFGKSAKVTGFGGHYRVTTPTGGEVLISPKGMKLIFGGDDVYRACTLLAGDRWGTAKVRGGSREFILGMMAHGEASGVAVRVDHSNRFATFMRRMVFLVLIVAALAMGLSRDGGSACAVTLGVALLLWWLMKRSAKRKEQHKAEQLGFHYPRVHGTAGAASHDDLERKGWV